LGVLAVQFSFILSDEPGKSKSAATIDAARRSHWAFQPVKQPSLPAVKRRDWPATEVDFFILAALEERGLEPSPPASRHALIRRLSFDLTGLPPAPEEVDAFLADGAPEAYDRLVDRLLASPRHGERWGRHWLDVARYADSKGYVFQEERNYPYSYTYRDYVIRAMNDDLPYDRFILEQLAADRLDLGADQRPLAAMGFLTLGRRFLNNLHDIIDDRIDVVSRGLLGLTAVCARCHDHKYDPITMKDYYGLHGIFASSIEPQDLPLLGPAGDGEAARSFEKELAARQAEVQKFIAAKHGELLQELRRQAPDYMLASLEEKNLPREGAGLSFGAGDLRPPVVRRWRNFLEEARKNRSSVFALWHSLTALPEERFPGKAGELVAKLAENVDSGQTVNPFIARAFLEKPPLTLKEAAERYGEVFSRVLASAAPKQDRLADPNQEAVRQAIEGPGSPFNLSGEELTRLLDRASKNRLRELEAKVEQLKTSHPGAPARAMVLVDAPSPADSRLLIRGNPGNPGAEVPRRFFEVLSPPEAPPFSEGSGRLDLARAIASRENPLTARVLVNRVWQHCFEKGLVRTPGDFGSRGEPPTHPELLDYLAWRFMAEGWSMKKLHRLILRSKVYQQASDDRPEGLERDPENRWLWKRPRRRLDFEALRDALLAVAGRLDLTPGGRAVDLFSQPFTGRRSVYGFIERQNLPGVLRTFDFASPDATCPQRHETCVPQQALFLMNSPFAFEQAKRLAARPEAAAKEKPEERIGALYRLALGRAPAEEEVELGLKFLKSEPAAGEAKLSPWERYAQVLLMSNEFSFLD
ncbi:MAG: DUF1553 domain-containing protein, partial [Planctomycetes bacterium]|nr:DUF1553 domain-containing protein [Planctomycetota bacterium]